jgi:site-specific DNA-methyltransferase (adenine-specific)
MEPTDILGNIKLYNADCMEVMKTFNDNQFSLAIIDPPYGIGVNQMNMGGRSTVKPTKKDWDKEVPSKEYFKELFRVSKNQIIWGGNYFKLPPSRCFVVWDKGEMMYGRSFAECEYAWVSMDKSARIYKLNPTQLDRFHPTQKPVQLYKWLLQNYAKEGDTILDTHFGSLSIGIACYDLKFDLTAIELDKDYYEQAKQRLINHQRQLTIF